jgi:hypothetical protein
MAQLDHDGEKLGSRELLTSLGGNKLSKELHGGALKRRRHLVRVLEFIDGPVPELLHVIRDVVGVVGAVFRDRCGHLGLCCGQTNV